jgi:5-methylcytosine-specific restriction protein A
MLGFKAKYHLLRLKAKKSEQGADMMKTCPCGYTTADRGNMSKHKKYYCRERIIVVSPVESELRERVAADAQRIASLEAQVAADREQLAAKEERIAVLEQMLGHQLLEVKEELKQTKKRKDRYAEVAATRRPLTEPERRKIAQDQGWRCADPDGGCLLPGELQEFDIDHVLPLWKGGQDETVNMQALCPACHRRKTPPAKLVGERSIGTFPNAATQGPGG